MRLYLLTSKKSGNTSGELGLKTSSHQRGTVTSDFSGMITLIFDLPELCKHEGMQRNIVHSEQGSCCTVALLEIYIQAPDLVLGGVL